MAVQFEDVIDVLQVMHPAYDFIFLFDPCAGHSKQRPDRLNQLRMNRSFGGKGALMHSTTILQEEGFLGPFLRTLQPGNIQSLVFTATDSGPFWMTNEEKGALRHGKQLGATTDIKLSGAEMVFQLSENGIVETERLSTRQLRDLCTRNGISSIRVVANSVERNRSELELELKGLGVNIRGKNKRELIELCNSHNIAT